ncbi:hypothetical protein [Magnetospira thiophila]
MTRPKENDINKLPNGVDHAAKNEPRIKWPFWIGMGGRFPSESVAGFIGMRTGVKQAVGTIAIILHSLNMSLHQFPPDFFLIGAVAGIDPREGLQTAIDRLAAKQRVQHATRWIEGFQGDIGNGIPLGLARVPESLRVPGFRQGAFPVGNGERWRRRIGRFRFVQSIMAGPAQQKIVTGLAFNLIFNVQAAQIVRGRGRPLNIPVEGP